MAEDGLANVEPEDLAQNLRQSHPYLPAVWAGGPGRNIAARNMAFRIGRYVKEGREVPLHEMQWFETYARAQVRKRRTFLYEEEEILQQDEDGNGAIKATDIAMQLLHMLITLRKDHADRIDRLKKDYEDRIDRVQERNDGQNMEFIKILQKDKDSTIKIIHEAYSGSNASLNKNMASFVPLVEALLKTSTGMAEQFGKLNDESHKKVLELINNVQKPGNFELLLTMILAPALPVILPEILKKIGAPIPEGFAAFIQNTITKALSTEST